MKKLSIATFVMSLILTSIINLATKSLVDLGIGIYTALGLLILATWVVEGKAFGTMEKTARKFVVMGALFIVLLIGGLCLLMNVQFGAGLMAGSLLGSVIIALNERIALYLLSSIQNAGNVVYEKLEDLTEVGEVIVNEKALAAKVNNNQSQVIDLPTNPNSVKTAKG